jgi:hypothetical protein
VQNRRSFDEQHGRHEREGGIFAAGDIDFAAELPTSLNL